MATHCRHSVEFKRQVVQEYLDGGTLHGLAKRHDIARNLIRIWLQKHEAGALDDESHAADVIQPTRPGLRRSNNWSVSKR